MALDSLYRQIRADRLERFEAAIASGVYRPYIWPWDTLPALWLFLGMLILPRLPLRTANIVRIPLLLLIFGQGIWSVVRCRSIGMAGGYGIGLATDWGFITAAGFLWFTDLKKDFQRLEIKLGAGKAEVGASNGSAEASGVAQKDVAARRQTSRTKGNQSDPTYTSTSTASHPNKPVWQSYPEDLWHCMGWLTDLLISFRGVNWNWRLAAFSPIDPKPESSSGTDIPTQQAQSKRGYDTPATIRDVQRQAIYHFILFYLGVDLAKTIVIHDPYFLGIGSIDSSHPLWLLQPHPVLTRIVRLLTSLFSVYVVLSLIFTLSPLLFPLLPTLLTTTTLHHPAMYPPQWSPHPLSPLLTHGLTGFWSRNWHQMFRAGISRPVSPTSTSSLLRTLNIPPRSRRARLLQITVAFTLTGSIHALAAYTSFPPNPAAPPRPVMGSGVFFLAQAGGIVLQTAVAGGLRSKGGWWPEWVRGVGNVGFVLLWLYWTGPVLTGDFARCGVWLFEPVPVSPFRGLLGEGWWCWGGRWAGLVREGPWYRSGIAIY